MSRSAVGFVVMRYVLPLIFLLATGCGRETGGLRRAVSAGDLAAVERAIDAEYPDVRQISPAELATMMEQQRVILLDVRDEQEFAVSHLPSARRVDENGPIDLRQPKDAQIVVYCSVGLRSSRFARRLAAEGFTHVASLRGSIFRWAIEGRPLSACPPDKPVVHPYNSSWGRLLPGELRAAL